MNSIYASDQFCQVIWPDFTAHFRNKSTEASYRTDVIEFMSIYQMDFLQITDGTCSLIPSLILAIIFR